MSALLFSVLESFFILPSHLVSFEKKKSKTYFNNLFLSIRGMYKSLIDQTLKYRYLSVGAFVLFSAGALWYSMDVEKNFNLNIGDEFVMLRGGLKQSSSKTETLKKTSDIYEFAKKIGARPEVIEVERGVGKLWSFGEELIGPEYFEIRLLIDETYPQPETVKNTLEKELDEFVEQYDKKEDKFEFLSVQRKYAGSEDKTDQRYLEVDFYTKGSGLS